MGKSNYASAGWLGLLFQAAPITNIAQNGTSPLTDLYVSLHTANPGAGGSQTTSEATYTSYARVAVVRTSSGWALSAETISPVANISFPAATGGSETETYAGIGTASSGAGNLLYSGPISPSIVVTNGVQPVLTTASTITES